MSKVIFQTTNLTSLWHPHNSIDRIPRDIGIGQSLLLAHRISTRHRQAGGCQKLSGDSREGKGIGGRVGVMSVGGEGCRTKEAEEEEAVVANID